MTHTREMSGSWAEEVEAAPADQAAAPKKAAYVPPHLRNKVASGGAPPTPTFSGPPPPGPRPPPGGGGAWGGPQGGSPPPRGGGWGGPSGGDRRGGGGRGGGGGWGAPRENDPFEEAARKDEEANELFTGENTGINFDAYEDIPVETSGTDCPEPISSFYDVEIHPALLANVKRCKFSKPTPVQRYSIPIGLSGRDLMACAQTGSGKTAAFCFPIILGILKSGVQQTGRSRKAFPLALVLSPTRELSSQIYDEARKFCYQTGLRPVVVYGGAPVVNQVQANATA